MGDSHLAVMHDSGACRMTLDPATSRNCSLTSPTEAKHPDLWALICFCPGRTDTDSQKKS